MNLSTHIDASFEDFKRGNLINQDDIKNILRENGFDATLLETNFGYYRKIVVRFLDHAKLECIAKIAFHSYARELLKNEILGYKEFSKVYKKFTYPEIILFSDHSDYSLSIMRTVPGQHTKYLEYSSSKLSLCSQKNSSEKIEIYLEKLIVNQKISEPLRSMIDRVKSKYRGHDVPMSASHGDFIYWNILKDQDAYALIDFEFFAHHRTLGFDHWHWFIYPLARKFLRLKLSFIMSVFIGLISAIVWKCFIKHDLDKTIKQPKMLLILYLIEQTLIFEREHSIDKITNLLGKETVDSRNKVLDLYITLGNRLL